jgi:hypothetical protein
MHEASPDSIIYRVFSKPQAERYRFSWSDAARIFEGAQQNPDLMKGFVNTVLGEPYEEEFENTKGVIRIEGQQHTHTTKDSTLKYRV